MKNRFRIDYVNHHFLFNSSSELEKELLVKEVILKTKLKKNEHKAGHMMKEGVLFKLSPVRKQWKKKYVILEDDLLLYYNKESAGIGLLPKSMSLCKCKITKFPKKLREHGFQIVSDSAKTMILAAETDSEYESWMEILVSRRKQCSMIKVADDVR